MLPARSPGLLLVCCCCLFLPGPAPAHLAFRCPSCTAELLAACPKIPPFCPEIVRELGCGCCPVCARQEGETCGVYTPRCSSGLRCYPSAEAALPLQQLLQGLGRCAPPAQLDVYSGDPGQQLHATNGKYRSHTAGVTRPLPRFPTVSLLSCVRVRTSTAADTQLSVGPQARMSPEAGRQADA